MRASTYFVMLRPLIVAFNTKSCQKHMFPLLSSLHGEKVVRLMYNFALFFTVNCVQLIIINYQLYASIDFSTFPHIRVLHWYITISSSRIFHTERVIVTDLQREKLRLAMHHSARTFKFVWIVAAISIMSQLFILLGYLITAWNTTVSPYDLGVRALRYSRAAGFLSLDLRAAENGKLTRYRANVTIDYLCITVIRDKRHDTRRRLASIHARRANYEFFLRSLSRFTKHGSGRDKLH